MDLGLRQAINVPLALAQHVDTMWQLLIQMAAVANINCKSDLQVSSNNNKAIIIISVNNKATSTGSPPAHLHINRTDFVY